MKSSLSWIAATICLLVTGSVTAAERPNIIYIMADDLGIGDVKCYGRERCQIKTPNFDRLAKEGMRFTDAHAITSHCIPTRMAIMTGRYPWRFCRPRPDGPWGYLNPRLKLTRITLGKMLGQAGYHTGYVGKWHLGTLMQTTNGKNQGPTNVDFTKPLKIGPADYGFDYSWILPGSLDMYPYVYVKNNQFVGRVTARKGWSAFNRVGPAAEDFEDVAVLDTFSRQAEQYIARRAKDGQKKPFFLYLALTAPHTPTSPSARFRGKNKLGVYADFVTETDDCIGRVLAALDKHKLAGNTLVIATSDHGAACYAGNTLKATPNQIRLLEKQGHHSSGIFRGYKFSCYEGGLRVPFVVRWPQVIKPASTCDRLIGLVDVLQTFAEVASLKVPTVAAPDSVSFLPLLKNAQATGKRQALIMQSTRAFVIRRGKWKLAICPGSGCNGHWGNRPRQADAWRKALQKFAKRPTRADLLRAPFVQLFDLANDPGERHNLAQKHPDRVQAMIADLRRRIRTGTSFEGVQAANDRPVNILGGLPRFVRRQLQTN